jgi:hypothetical protein
MTRSFLGERLSLFGRRLFFRGLMVGVFVGTGFLNSGALAADHEIFIDHCGGKKTGYDLNLSRACKEYPGKVLVRCKHECVDRKLLICQKRVWKQVDVIADAALCSKGGEQNKVRDCNSKELELLSAARTTAVSKTSDLLPKVRKVAEILSKKKASQAGEWREAVSCLEKVKEAYQNPFRYYCPNDGEGSEGEYCASKKSRMGFNNPGGLNRFVACKRYFDGYSDSGRFGTFLHETTHEVCKTEDHKYYGDSSAIRSSDQWEKTADTYDGWIRYGFCIPKKDECQPYEAWLKENS